MKQLFKKKKKLSASSLLLAGLFLCIVLSVGCSVVKNTSGKILQERMLNQKIQ